MQLDDKELKCDTLKEKKVRLHERSAGMWHTTSVCTYKVKNIKKSF